MTSKRLPIILVLSLLTANLFAVNRNFLENSVTPPQLSQAPVKGAACISLPQKVCDGIVRKDSETRRIIK